jgi:hypothetical protein
VRPRRQGLGLLCGPSTSPLDVMAIGYNWTCTACGATNAAGTNRCGTCGGGAVISAAQIQTQAAGPSSVLARANGAKKFLIVSSLIAFIAGLAMERASIPPMTIWYVGVGLMVVSGILLALMAAQQSRK